MPASERCKCWTNRSKVQRLLIVLLSITIFIVIILLIVLLRKQSQTALTNDICSSKTCMNKAQQILKNIDPNIDPCDDFYQFACGNFLRNAHGDTKLNWQYRIQQEKKRRIMAMYSADIQKDDHRMVKAAKNLFKKCMDEEAIEKDNLRTIRDALREAGGWPVLEYQWDEMKFDWLKATYKLRQLGYPFSIFLDLEKGTEDENEDKYIFKVRSIKTSMKELNAHYSSTDSHSVSDMTQIAIIFGAVGFRDEIERDMQTAKEFGNRLLDYGSEINQNITVKGFQQTYGKGFDWLDFINTIAVPARISKDDFVLFESEVYLKEIIELLSGTPKRTLANYMGWKVIEQQLPYLTRNLQRFRKLKEENETRADFCIREIEERIKPSAIEIMHDRKYLPADKKKQVEETLSNIKDEFVKLLENTIWASPGEKKMILEKAKRINIIVGRPENYFDDKILDDLDVDMIETRSDTFLSILAQINRNHQSSIYYRSIRKPTVEDLVNRSQMQYQNGLTSKDDFLIFISTNETQDFVSDEKRLHYLNYGFFGPHFLGLLAVLAKPSIIERKGVQGWSKETNEVLNNKLQCYENQTGSKNTEAKLIAMVFAPLYIVGGKISYAAYEKLIKSEGEERKLIGVNYTPRQLFWIVPTNCYASNPNQEKRFYEDTATFANATNLARRNDPNFVKDFNCTLGSKMNPSNKCELF